MGKPRDLSKERYWRKLVERQLRGGESVRRFCCRVGVPEHRFRWWQRTLRERDGEGAIDPPDLHPCHRASASSEEAEPAAFVPVRLPLSITPPVEIVHPEGWVVRVPVGWDGAGLRQVLAALDRPIPQLPGS